MSLLAVENLRVTFPTPSGPSEAVRGVSFTLGSERLAIVGESGSGKTTMGRAILRLIRPPARVDADTLSFDGENLLALSERRMRTLRGARISMIMQDPRYSLNPIMRVGEQMSEMVRVHRRTSRRRTREQVAEMLRAVRIRDVDRVMGAYPHELSGGMGQRVVIATMLLPEPDIVIADEPTSALDATVEREVLAVLDELVARRHGRSGMGLILISHDLRLVSRFCDRVLVVYRGRIVEEIEAARLAEARHPYTRGLLECLPRIGAREGGRARPLPTLDRAAPWTLER